MASKKYKRKIKFPKIPNYRRVAETYLAVWHKLRDYASKNNVNKFITRNRYIESESEVGPSMYVVGVNDFLKKYEIELLVSENKKDNILIKIKKRFNNKVIVSASSKKEMPNNLIKTLDEVLDKF